MNQSSCEVRADHTVGIIGFGHLGHSLVVGLLKNGFQKERLLISHGGSEKTARKLREAGLLDCRSDAKRLAARADIVIMAVRPQDALALSELSFKPNALLISFMAGLPINLLQTIFCKDVHRTMCSGPETILCGNGIATLCPEDERVAGVLRSMGMTILRTASEGELDSFTAGICLPAILLNIRVPNQEVRDTLDEMRKTYPVYGLLRDWIKQVTPDGDIGRKDEYLANVSTKGGISEAMTNSLKSGNSLLTALHHGLERGRAITDEIRKGVLESLELAG